MGYAVVNSRGDYANAWSRWDNPPRPLIDGESVVECEWDDELNKPVGLELPPPAPLRKLAPYDFQARFTDAELVAIQTSIDPLIIRGRTMLQTIVTFVDLDDPQTQQLVGYMQMIGLLTAERAAEILA